MKNFENKFFPVWERKKKKKKKPKQQELLVDDKNKLGKRRKKNILSVRRRLKRIEIEKDETFNRLEKIKKALQIKETMEERGYNLKESDFLDFLIKKGLILPEEKPVKEENLIDCMNERLENHIERMKNGVKKLNEEIKEIEDVENGDKNKLSLLADQILDFLDEEFLDLKEEQERKIENIYKVLQRIDNIQKFCERTIQNVLAKYYQELTIELKKEEKRGIKDLEKIKKLKEIEKFFPKDVTVQEKDRMRKLTKLQAKEKEYTWQTIGKRLAQEEENKITKTIEKILENKEIKEMRDLSKEERKYVQFSYPQEINYIFQIRKEIEETKKDNFQVMEQLITEKIKSIKEIERIKEKIGLLLELKRQGKLDKSLDEELKKQKEKLREVRFKLKGSFLEVNQLLIEAVKHLKDKRFLEISKDYLIYPPKRLNKKGLIVSTKDNSKRIVFKMLGFERQKEEILNYLKEIEEDLKKVNDIYPKNKGGEEKTKAALKEIEKLKEKITKVFSYWEWLSLMDRGLTNILGNGKVFFALKKRLKKEQKD